jgi:hypothetical protein
MDENKPLATLVLTASNRSGSIDGFIVSPADHSRAATGRVVIPPTATASVLIAYLISHRRLLATRCIPVTTITTAPMPLVSGIPLAAKGQPDRQEHC